MNRRCPHCQSEEVIKVGFFIRKDDSKKIQRFRCKDCHKNFSNATFSSCYKQKKRRFNAFLGKLLCSGNSQRRCALILGLNIKTIARKLLFLAEQARIEHQHFLEYYQTSHLQFDDLITSHHTKLKPLTVPVAVDGDNRYILGVEVGEIAAFGKMASLSRKKYGKRRSQHKECLKKLMQKIAPTIAHDCKIKSDAHKFYREAVDRYLPEDLSYQQYSSKRGSVAGQGELKQRGYDPLFTINHALAMLRADINRLIRKTWNTTKDPQRLYDHLCLYINFYNKYLLETKKS